jgi:hypothetical protein
LLDNLEEEMVGRDGFEPSTNWLKANCSTTELTTRRKECASYYEIKKTQVFL